MDNLNIEKKIQDILNKNLLNAKRELLLFVNQTKETIQYKTDKQGYIKELLADYSKLSINKDGTINFIGRSYINSGYPLLSDDDLLAMMRQFYLGYANNPRLGENVAIAAAESDGRVFLERWSKYNWLKTLLDMLVQPQQVQASTVKKTFKDRVIAKNKEETLNKLHSLIDGKRGKNVALVVVASVEMGLIEKPTYKEVKSEFGDIGAESGYNKYLNKAKFTSIEYEGIKTRLSD